MGRAAVRFWAGEEATRYSYYAETLATHTDGYALLLDGGDKWAPEVIVSAADMRRVADFAQGVVEATATQG